jgi:catechol 2,3-dioxygenase-like lactoylglutathione lyase family enzyme
MFIWYAARRTLNTERRTAMSQRSVSLQGVILHVADLDRAVSFYADLLDLALAHHDEEAAVLADAGGADAIALRQRHVDHFTDRTVQALIWTVPTLAALDDIERRLRRLGAAAARHEMPDEAVTLLSAWDRDGQRLLFTHRDDNRAASSDRIPAEVYWY